MSLVTVYGTEATAAFGIYIKLETLVMIPLFSISSALGPFMGQNYGAKIFPRLKTAYKYSFVFVAAYGLVLASSIYYFGSYLILPFSKDEAVVRIAWKTLSLISFSYAFQGLTLLAVSSFNSPRKATAFVCVNDVKNSCSFDTGLLGLRDEFWS